MPCRPAQLIPRVSRVHSSRRTQACQLQSGFRSRQPVFTAASPALLHVLLAALFRYGEAVCITSLCLSLPVWNARYCILQPSVDGSARECLLSHAPAHLDFHSFATSRSASLSTRVGELLSRIMILMTAAKCLGKVRSGGIGRLDPP